MTSNTSIFGAVILGVALGAGGMGALAGSPARSVAPSAPVDTSPENGCTGVFRRLNGVPCDGNGDGATCGHLVCPPAPTATPTGTVRPACSEAPSAAPFEEVCDGRDNDCDGQTDEGFKLRLPCSVVCPTPDGGTPARRLGTSACNTDGTVGCNISRAKPCP